MKKIVMLAAIAGTASAALAQNTGAWLTDGNASFGFGATGASATSVTLTTAHQGNNPTTGFYIGGGSLNNSFNANWYYRVDGDVRERNPASAVARTLTGTNTVTYDYGNLRSGLSTAPTAISGTAYRTQYTVLSTGANSGALNTFFTVFNNTQTDLVINIFFAMDMDLGGNNANGFAGDAYAALDTSGGNRTWNVTDTGATNGPGPWAALIQGFGASGAGVGGFSAINGQMTDTSVDNFIPDLNAGGLAAADNAWVMQWRVTIAPGASFQAGTHVNIGNNGVVPTPGAAALLGLGGLAAARRRRA